MVYVQPSICPWGWHTCDLDIQTYNLISARRPDLIIINNKREFAIVDFDVPADHRIKLKESEKKYEYLDLARELKKLWNMMMAIIPIVIGAFSTVIKWLLKELEDLEVGGGVILIHPKGPSMYQTTWFWSIRKVLLCTRQSDFDPSGRSFCVPDEVIFIHPGDPSMYQTKGFWSILEVLLCIRQIDFDPSWKSHYVLKWFCKYTWL